MKSKFYLALLTFTLLPFSETLAKEISLFGSNGEAVAYIAANDDMTIYLWDGTPVAYLSGGSIYGFNGKHLGWFTSGIVLDHNGFVVGGQRNAIGIATRAERAKFAKRAKPAKNARRASPARPARRLSWSSTPLASFLAGGRH